MASKGKFTLQTLLALGIDGLAFAGSNELVAMAGYKGARVGGGDIMVYLVVDFLIRRGYLVNADLMGSIADISDNGMGEVYNLEFYKGIIAAIGLILKDSLKNKKLVLMNPIIKAAVGALGNGFVDDIFKLKKIA